MTMFNDNNSNDSEVNYEKSQVECHSGYKANEYPVAFIALGRRWEISEIVDRWYEGGIKPDSPVVNYFKVKTNEGSLFILRYDTHADVWSVVFKQ
jgi:hypothetical protein